MLTQHRVDLEQCCRYRFMLVQNTQRYHFKTVLLLLKRLVLLIRMTPRRLMVSKQYQNLTTTQGHRMYLIGRVM